MITHSPLEVEKIIKNYLEFREKSNLFGKRKMDSEKEYNRLLTKYNGAAKHYSLEQANSIYISYLEMIANGEASALAQAQFIEAEEKLREVGRILFEATINAEILVTPLNGDTPAPRPVTITYHNGQVIVS